MKKLLLSIAFLACIYAHAQNYWQQQVNYTIDVSLNDVEHSLTGFIKIQYINHSPDTLHFIWFHIWPNAYKNDKTAFSDQLLENNRTDFYFSDKEQRGYINRLDFRIDGSIARTEDHPEFIDIIKVILQRPLAPGDSIRISTPFYEKLPFNFSRGGHVRQTYQVTQWYPKPAVYDQKGWHAMPYLDQGEFYSEFGNYDVRITVPEDYVVAATGELQDEEEEKWMINKFRNPISKDPKPITKKTPTKNRKPAARKKSLQTEVSMPTHDTITKTLQYRQNKIHDFAWFADKTFIVNYDTAQLSPGKIVKVYSYHTPEGATIWKKSISYIKDALRFHSSVIGEYPFNVMSVVEAKTGSPGGMEYPTITSISPLKDKIELDLTISHEIGHNWFYAAIGSNERRYPWMDEGLNTYYDKRYEEWKYGTHNPGFRNGWFKNKLPSDWNKLFLDILEKEKMDQPISTSSQDFNEINYNLIPYDKAGLWLHQLQDSMSTALFDSCMHVYFREWQFRHPYPEDFMSVMELNSGKKLTRQFALLNQNGSLDFQSKPKKIKPTFFFSLKNTDKFSYINIGPGIGYNMYDKFMIGTVMHNYNLPPNNFEFFLAPLYATESRQLKGIGNMSYSWHPETHFQKISIGINGSTFSTNAATDSNFNKVFEKFQKIVPYIRLTFKNKSARSSLERWIDFKTFLITEKKFDKYVFISADSNLHPTSAKYSNRYLNQLSFNISDYRILYPYNLQLQIQQTDIFYRINLTGNYFFNYDNNGGMNVRFFAAKFGYWNHKTSPDISRYQPKLLGVTGEEDYTYSNYFLGRTASNAIEEASVNNSGLAAQQIMIRDGGFKLRIDQYDFLQGKSDNWVTALNFNTTLPNHLFPVKIPVKIFFDVGTYAEAWKTNALTSRFLYVGGVQLSLFKNIINIYFPLIYSSDFRDQLKTIPEQNTFWKRITFSIDVQNFDTKKLFRNIAFHQ